MGTTCSSSEHLFLKFCLRRGNLEPQGKHRIAALLFTLVSSRRPFIFFYNIQEIKHFIHKEHKINYCDKLLKFFISFWLKFKPILDNKFSELPRTKRGASTRQNLIICHQRLLKIQWPFVVSCEQACTRGRVSLFARLLFNCLMNILTRSQHVPRRKLSTLYDVVEEPVTGLDWLHSDIHFVAVA